MSTDTITEAPILTAKDFATDQEVRWCPGCGDYSILAQVQKIMPNIGVPKENIVIISGIGCSSRFPYYMNTFGMHSIHGRATAIASGLKATRPELSVWIVTGDGDSLSIGGNHTIHLLRRNFDVNIMMFNNQIYGLTKGQYSPTSEEHKITKSTPYGSIDHPFNPAALALGADASFIARSMDRDPKHLQAMLLRANAHKGASFHRSSRSRRRSMRAAHHSRPIRHPQTRAADARAAARTRREAQSTLLRCPESADRYSGCRRIP
jgi:2-oxoglutarate ferredoxin oxidoreductase subunit beta